VYRLLKRHQDALRVYSLELRIWRELKVSGKEADVLNRIGRSQLALKRHDEALKSHQQALRVVRALRNRADEAHTLLRISQVYEAQGRYDQALHYTQQGLAIERETGDIIAQARSLNNLMVAWDNLKNPRLAIFYGKQSVNVYQQIRRNLQKLDKASQLSYVQSNERPYRMLANLLIDEGRLSEAQQVLGMLKEEEIFQFVRRDAAQAQDDSRATLNTSKPSGRSATKKSPAA
jgi:tetratricopeptide (TPR) repeat protein